MKFTNPTKILSIDPQDKEDFCLGDYLMIKNNKWCHVTNKWCYETVLSGIHRIPIEMLWISLGEPNSHGILEAAPAEAMQILEEVTN